MLNRNSIKNGVIYNLLKKNQHITNMAPKTLEERSASLELTLSKAPNGAVKNGIWIMLRFLLRIDEYNLISCSYVIISGPPISKILPAVSLFCMTPIR